MSSAPPPALVPFRTAAEQHAAVDRVVEHLRAGGLIAYPTETVYGFGCTLRSDALARLAAVKRRSSDRPFLLLVTGRRMLPALEWTAEAEALADAFWPGPLTLALRVPVRTLPKEVVSGAGTVAVRATPHAGVRLLVERCGEPLTSTSANEPGQPPAGDAATAGRALAAAAGGWPVLVLDGGTLPASSASTIVDCSVVPPRLVRAGAIGAHRLAEIINGIESTQS